MAGRDILLVDSPDHLMAILGHLPRVRCDFSKLWLYHVLFILFCLWCLTFCRFVWLKLFLTKTLWRYLICNKYTFGASLCFIRLSMARVTKLTTPHYHACIYQTQCSIPSFIPQRGSTCHETFWIIFNELCYCYLSSGSSNKSCVCHWKLLQPKPLHISSKLRPGPCLSVSNLQQSQSWGLDRLDKRSLS